MSNKRWAIPVLGILWVGSLSCSESISTPTPVGPATPAAKGSALPQPASSNPSSATGNRPAQPTTPSSVGAGGSAAPVTTAPPTTSLPPAATTPMVGAASGTPAMGGCGLHTRWQGDDVCIPPPPADKGFQVHIGPSNYDNPESKYVLQPGAEVTETFPAMTGNDKDVYYYYRQYRMRPGTHHMIMMTSGADMRRLGGSQNVVKDNPEGGNIAPENKGVGMKLAAKTPLNINLHYINTTTAPILKEIWINFWYRNASDVTEPALEMFSGTPMNVMPGQHVIMRGECPITKAGRVLQLYGHRHANNHRFSVMRVRAGKEEIVYEDYDWVEPLFLEFSSLVQNPMANRANQTRGGYSGVLDLMPGDTLAFECDIVNNTSRTFVGKNEALDDEMCIMVGDTVGTQISPLCSVKTTPVTAK